MFVNRQISSLIFIQYTLFVTLLRKTSTSLLLYCNDYNKFLVDVERFVFYCDLLIVLILHGLV